MEFNFHVESHWQSLYSIPSLMPIESYQLMQWNMYMAAHRYRSICTGKVSAAKTKFRHEPTQSLPDFS